MKKYVIILFVVYLLIINLCSCKTKTNVYNIADVTYKVVKQNLSVQDYKSVQYVTDNIFRKTGVVNREQDAGNIACSVINAITDKKCENRLKVEFDEENLCWIVRDNSGYQITINKSNGEIKAYVKGKMYEKISDNYQEVTLIAYNLLKSVFKESVDTKNLNLTVLSKNEWMFEHVKNSKADGGEASIILEIPSCKIKAIWGGM